MARRAELRRETKETEIRVVLDLDGRGEGAIETPIGFLTHMVEQLARHGLLDLEVQVSGDTHVDGHHTTEDLAFVIGQAVAAALGERRGIRRYGAITLPMDEALIQCAIDLGGRPFLVFGVPLPKARVGAFDAELAEVFFEAFARGAGCNLHLHLVAGENLHHIIEGCFKALARALREAVAIDPREAGIPSTKGTLIS